MSSPAQYPQDLKYTKEHEWLRIEADGTGVVGVTHFAQSELGDVVYLDLPVRGTAITQGKIFGTIESVKAVSDLYAPVTGEVLDRNEELMDHPEVVNQDPHGKAWMLKVKLANASDAAALMSTADYEAYLKASGH